jgi:hypothetical protein
VDGEGSEPTYVLDGRDAPVPVFADPNRYEATTHFNGQSAAEIEGNHAAGESYTIAHHVYTDDSPQQDHDPSGRPWRWREHGPTKLFASRQAIG